jgi:nucleotide-binding universal stress UspA family protein
LFKNILIATDGSDLTAKAVEQGIRLAKEIGAKITAMTVTEPFHLLSIEPSQLENRPDAASPAEVNSGDVVNGLRV